MILSVIIIFILFYVVTNIFKIQQKQYIENFGFFDEIKHVGDVIGRKTGINKYVGKGTAFEKTIHSDSLKGAAIEAATPAINKILKKVTDKVYNKIDNNNLLKSYNFSSGDIRPIINEIDSVDDIQKISDNPEPLINSVETSLTKSGGIIDKSLVVGKINLKRILTPILPKYNLNYSDIEIIIEEIDTMSKLKEIERNPEYFLKSLLFVSKPLINKLIMLGFMESKPKIEPILNKYNLVWNDIDPILKFLTLDNIIKLGEDPEDILKELKIYVEPLLKKLLIIATSANINLSKLDKKYEGLSWEKDILPNLKFDLKNIDELENIKFNKNLNSVSKIQLELFSNYSNKKNYNNNTSDWSSLIFKSQYSKW